MKHFYLGLTFITLSIFATAEDYKVYGPQGGLAMEVTLPEDFNEDTDKCPMVILMHGIFSSKNMTAGILASRGESPAALVLVDFGQINRNLAMNIDFRDTAAAKWREYFPQAEMPVAVFYSDELCGAEYAPAPPQSKRGYVCMFAQLSKVHHGTALAFDAENIGCWGALRNLFGGPYQEGITVDLLVNIEKFKIDREQTNLLHQINPVAHPTGRYVIFKPIDLLTESDDPAIYCVFAKPDVISALHTLSSFDNTRIDNVIVPFGSGCEQMLTFAFDEARKENPRAILGGMDTAMRTCVKSDLLTFSFAAPMFERMVANMDKSFLTTYIWKPLMNR